ncbi:hypothetical protein ACE11A_23425 [Streptomyces carpaticus]|uniref:Uncharacterized protein n=1 Tax=Streptomyces carpaticus TaxID=285558 RepID=A0ABV4ZTL0_9ACTN
MADVPGGSCAGPDGLLEEHGTPKLVGRSKAARDLTVARRLWRAAEERTGTAFPLRTNTGAAR